MSKLSFFDFAKMTYTKPKKIDGMYLSKTKYEGNEINMQLKRKITLSGIYREGNKYYVDLIFNNESEKDKTFINLYKKLEMMSIKEIYNKYNEWMREDQKLEWEDIYTSFKSHLTEEDNLKRIKFNLITNNNMMETEFYNETLEKVSFKNVEGGDELSLILMFDGIKFGKKNFENYWKVLQVKIYDQEKTIEDVCEIIETDDETENNESIDIDIEDMEKMNQMVEKIYEKYREEEALKIID